MDEKNDKTNNGIYCASVNAVNYIKTDGYG